MPLVYVFAFHIKGCQQVNDESPVRIVIMHTKRQRHKMLDEQAIAWLDSLTTKRILAFRKAHQRELCDNSHR